MQKSAALGADFSFVAAAATSRRLLLHTAAGHKEPSGRVLTSPAEVAAASVIAHSSVSLRR